MTWKWLAPFFEWCGVIGRYRRPRRGWEVLPPQSFIAWDDGKPRTVKWDAGEEP